MSKIQTVTISKAKSDRLYTGSELQAFHDEILAKYRVERTLSTGEKITVTDYKQMHRDYKTVEISYDPKYEDKVLVYTVDGEFISPTPFEILEDKIKQYQTWRRGKEFGEKMKMADLNKVAETMKVPSVVIPEV